MSKLLIKIVSCGILPGLLSFFLWSMYRGWSRPLFPFLFAFLCLFVHMDSSKRLGKPSWAWIGLTGLLLLIFFALYTYYFMPSGSVFLAILSVIPYLLFSRLRRASEGRGHEANG